MIADVRRKRKRFYKTVMGKSFPEAILLQFSCLDAAGWTSKVVKDNRCGLKDL
jgi:hypothetical protein